MHLLMVKELKSRPETMHWFPLLSDVGFLLTCKTLIDQVLHCIADVVCCWMQISGSSSWQTLQTYVEKEQMYGWFLAVRSGTQVTPVPNTHHTDVAAANSLYRDKRQTKEGSHCLSISSHTVVTSQSIKQLWTELCQKEHHGVSLTLQISCAQFNYINCSGY